jgi:hypothetical protein
MQRVFQSIVILIIILVSFNFSCKSDRRKSENIFPVTYKDSIEDSIDFSDYDEQDRFLFRTSRDNFEYIGERLYPIALPSDYHTLEMDSEIVSISKVGDTLFVFLNNEILCYSQNPYFPPLNDSLIEFYYSNYYDIKIIEPDVPYVVHLKSAKDFIRLHKNVINGALDLGSATITDTVLSFFSGVTTGMDKSEVFARLSFPEIAFDSDDFSVILCHASTPSEAWFSRFFKGKAPCPTVQILLIFRKGILRGIVLNGWIGYGNMGDYKVPVFEDQER